MWSLKNSLHTHIQLRDMLDGSKIYKLKQNIESITATHTHTTERHISLYNEQ